MSHGLHQFVFTSCVLGFWVAMVGRRFIFDDGASDQVGSGSQRVNEVTEPNIEYEFNDKPFMSTVKSITASRPSRGILKENKSSSFKEFDMLKLR